MWGILQDHWPFFSTISRLKETQAWGYEKLERVLLSHYFTMTNNWENWGFVFLEPLATEFSEQPLTQYPQRGGYPRGWKWSWHWAIWGRPNHTAVGRAQLGWSAYLQGVLCVLMRVGGIWALHNWVRLNPLQVFSPHILSPGAHRVDWREC